VVERPASASLEDVDMTKDQKIIGAKVGLLELAKQPGNSLPRLDRGFRRPVR